MVTDFVITVKNLGLTFWSVWTLWRLGEPCVAESFLILFPVKQRHVQASSIQNCPYKLFKLIPGFTHFHHHVF